MTDTNHSVKQLLLSQAKALRASADVLEAQAAALPDATGNASDLLDVEQTLEIYKIGRDGLLNAQRRGELHLVRGARNRIMVERSELERYIKSRPVVTRKTAPAASLDAWERQAEVSLRALKGGR